MGAYFSSTILTTSVNFPTSMRSVPSLEQTTGVDFYRISRDSTADLFDSFATINQPGLNCTGMDATSLVSGTAGVSGRVIGNNAGAKLAFNAEL
jgi:hypothetical protein